VLDTQNLTLVKQSLMSFYLKILLTIAACGSAR